MEKERSYFNTGSWRRFFLYKKRKVKKKRTYNNSLRKIHSYRNKAKRFFLSSSYSLISIVGEENFHFTAKRKKNKT